MAGVGGVGTRTTTGFGGVAACARLMPAAAMSAPVATVEAARRPVLVPGWLANARAPLAIPLIAAPVAAFAPVAAPKIDRIRFHPEAAEDAPALPVGGSGAALAGAEGKLASGK